MKLLSGWALIWHLLSGIGHYPLKANLEARKAGDSATLVVSILNHEAPPRGSGKPYKVTCEVQREILDITFFKASKFKS